MKRDLCAIVKGQTFKFSVRLLLRAEWRRRNKKTGDGLSTGDSHHFSRLLLLRAPGPQALVWSHHARLPRQHCRYSGTQGWTQRKGGKTSGCPPISSLKCPCNTRKKYRCQRKSWWNCSANNFCWHGLFLLWIYRLLCMSEGFADTDTSLPDYLPRRGTA